MRALAALAFASCSLTANAAWTTDASDLWWNSSENGWGVNVVQQYDTLFLTFFVYDSNGLPTWYVAPANVLTNPGASTAAFTGTLYQTNGPWFGGATFNPNAVSVRAVGTATFTLTAVEAATLSYSVNGTSVFKSLRRQTWKAENLTGSYIGAAVGTYSGCAANGYAEEPAYVSITQTGTAFSMSAQYPVTGQTCTYSGTYAQNGRMGSATGSISCTNGAGGTFNAFEIEGTPSGFFGRAVTSLGGSCGWSGHLGGLRRSQ